MTGLVLVGALSFALGFLLYRPGKSRYMETTDWQREHWEKQHEREKILLHREL